MTDNQQINEPQTKPAKKKRNLTEEQRQVLRERLAKYRPIINDKRKAEKAERLKKELETIHENKKEEQIEPVKETTAEKVVVKQKNETKPVDIPKHQGTTKKPKYMKVVFYEKPNEDVPFKIKFGKKQRPTLHYVSPVESEDDDESESEEENVKPTRAVSNVPDYSQYFD